MENPTGTDDHAAGNLPADLAKVEADHPLGTQPWPLRIPLTSLNGTRLVSRDSSKSWVVFSLAGGLAAGVAGAGSGRCGVSRR
jgi:hypothetical protein